MSWILHVSFIFYQSFENQMFLMKLYINCKILQFLRQGLFNQLFIIYHYNKWQFLSCLVFMALGKGQYLTFIISNFVIGGGWWLFFVFIFSYWRTAFEMIYKYDLPWRQTSHKIIIPIYSDTDNLKLGTYIMICNKAYKNSKVEVILWLFSGWLFYLNYFN